MMSDNGNSLYAVFKAKDTRFDGRIFVGISSTGIYCRPVCKARVAKAENCNFFSTAAEAEQAGYRPCLLCRPEVAPGTSVTDSSKALVQRAARMLEESCGNGESLDELAARLGCTARHLRRVFAAEYNVSPVQYLQTCRLLLAKNLLTDTNLPVLEVAMAAGFGSLRRFNDLFKSHYHLSPTDLRKRLPQEKQQSGEISVSLGYRPPYEWGKMLSFLSQRAIPGAEIVRNGEYLRTVRLANAEKEIFYGWLRVSHKSKKNILTVSVSESLLKVLPQVLARVRHLFDLYCEPNAVYEAIASMNNIRSGLCVLGARLPGCFNSFEMAVRAILGQQITVKAARTLAARLTEAFGVPLQTGIEGLTHVFPSPEDIISLDEPITDRLGPLGIIGTRANTIKAIAQAIVQSEIDFDVCVNPEKEMEKLRAIHGIGNWTAQYIAMRAMGWTDAFPETDAGLKKALAPKTPKEMLEIAEAWRPWRSYATINLWNSLSE